MRWKVRLLPLFCVSAFFLQISYSSLIFLREITTSGIIPRYEVLGKDADVLVHEATNSFLKGIDKDGNMGLVTRDAKIHGHSTPLMAGDFAKRINAKKLVLNHFSARYKGDQSVESITIMTRMERQAMKASGLPENSVAAAWDFMVLPVSRNE